MDRRPAQSLEKHPVKSRTIAVLETSASRVLGKQQLNSTLLRVAREFSRQTRVLVACWHQMDVSSGSRPRLRPPFLEFEQGEWRVWSPPGAEEVDAAWHFPVALARQPELTSEELEAESRFAATGIR